MIDDAVFPIDEIDPPQMWSEPVTTQMPDGVPHPLECCPEVSPDGKQFCRYVAGHWGTHCDGFSRWTRLTDEEAIKTWAALWESGEPACADSTAGPCGETVGCTLADGHSGHEHIACDGVSVLLRWPVAS